jgi:hypothetical protein
MGRVEEGGQGVSIERELLLLIVRGLRDKASLTARDWKRLRELEDMIGDADE